jgi:hypothetical protein
MKMSVFWDILPFSLVEVYGRYRELNCFHHQEDHVQLLKEYTMQPEMSRSKLVMLAYSEIVGKAQDIVLRYSRGIHLGELKKTAHIQVAITFASTDTGTIFFFFFWKMVVFWYVPLSSLLDIDRSCRGAYCLFHQGDESSRPCIAENSHMRACRRENLKSELFEWCSGALYTE